MSTYRMRVWTGPALVRQIADKLAEAGVDVVYVGTENLLVDGEGADPGGAAWNVLAAMYAKHGTDYGLRPCAITRMA